MICMKTRHFSFMITLLQFVVRHVCVHRCTDTPDVSDCDDIFHSAFTFNYNRQTAWTDCMTLDGQHSPRSAN